MTQLQVVYNVAHPRLWTWVETELTSDSESLYRASRLYRSEHWHVGPVRGAFLDRNCLVSEHRTMIALRYEDNSPHVGEDAPKGTSGLRREKSTTKTPWLRHSP